MRTITTSKGITYEVIYAWAPLWNGACGIALNDSRNLSEIAAEFEGLAHIHFTDDETGEADFDGYTLLTQLSRAGQAVQMTLTKEA